MKPGHPHKLSFHAVLVALISLVQGCGSSSDATLAGHWEIDREAVTNELTERIEQSDDPMEIGLARMAIGMVSGMDWRISMHDDGTLSLITEEDDNSLRAKGEWSLQGKAVNIEYVDERDRKSAMTGTLEGERIRIDPFEEGQPELLLKKVSSLHAGEALAAEDMPPVPPIGPLRDDCPPRLVAAPRSADAPVDDIVGLRPGMAYDDILALLECRDDIRSVQSAPLWSASQNYGIPTRQLLRASDGIPCSDAEIGARSANCDSGGGRFEPLRGITREYIVSFTGMPRQEVARAIWRRVLYTEDDTQAASVLTQSLSEKYGVPQLQATGDHLRINNVRAGATNLIWLYSRDGKPTPPPAGQFTSAALNYETCINGPQPQFATQHGWNSGCNLTIRAEILPRDGNRLLARELNMVVMNQRDLYHGGQQFEQALKIVSEDRLREQSARPEL